MNCSQPAAASSRTVSSGQGRQYRMAMPGSVDWPAAVIRSASSRAWARVVSSWGVRPSGLKARAVIVSGTPVRIKRVPYVERGKLVIITEDDTRVFSANESVEGEKVLASVLTGAKPA